MLISDNAVHFAGDGKVSVCSLNVCSQCLV